MILLLSLVVIATLMAILVLAVTVSRSLRRQLTGVRAELAGHQAAAADALGAHIERHSAQALTSAVERLAALSDHQAAQRTHELDARLQVTAERLNEQVALRSEAFDRQMQHMAGGLREVTGLVQRLQSDRAAQHGELVQRLEAATHTTSLLADTTQTLRDALANPKARGQWGERMADDVLRLAGFKEGVNYRRQSSTTEGTVPDFTFSLPGDLELNMDVKFPVDNYLRFLEADTDADRDRYRAAFARDVRARVKELTARGYADPQRTMGYVLLFIPNEAVYSFIHENDAELVEVAMRQQVVLCSPFTLFAVLGVIREAVDHFQLERTSDEILQCLARFGKEWGKFAEHLDKVDKHLGTLTNSVEQLNGPRRRMLERELARVDDLRSERGLLGDESEAIVDRPALRDVSGGPV